MSNSTVYLDKIYSKDGNTEIVDTVNRSVKAKTIELGGNIIASHSGVEGAGEVTLQNATLDSGVQFPAIGQLAFWHGYAGPSSSVTFTLDGVSSYTVIFNCRYTTNPYFPMNLTMVVNSANGTISNKTAVWMELSESFNNSSKVLTLSGNSTVEIMSILIFRGAITEGT